MKRETDLSIFDIIGPVMIGPSSSHTAGAVRLGNLARCIFGSKPKKVRLGLYGSFHDTGKGHGTDKALVAGLLGFSPEDQRIPNSFSEGRDIKIDFFAPEPDKTIHPNTVIFELSGDKEHLTIRGSSVGGGAVLVDRINNYPVELTGEYPSLLTLHKDRPGVILKVAEVLAGFQINIAYMKVFRLARGRNALMVIETDQRVPKDAQKKILLQEDIEWVRFVDKINFLG